MKKLLIALLLFYTVFAWAQRETVIADFETEIELISYPGEDNQPESWELSSDHYWGETGQSLHIFGDSWKILPIEPQALDFETVWQIAIYCDEITDIQGFGISDGENELKYSFYGYQQLDIETWIPHNQGAFESENWHLISLPVGHDWYAWYDYLPQIDQLIFTNDGYYNGSIYFDQIVDISEDLPIAPSVQISYELGTIRQRQNQRDINLYFSAEIEDPDSDTFSYLWHFGDGQTDSLASPTHNYIITDDHQYTVLLEVYDESQNLGLATTTIQLEEGESSLPLTLNFVGDIMIGRSFTGLINNYGVDYFFDPTYDYLGGAADLTIANLEVPFTTSNNHHPTKTVYFKADPQHALGLANAGIDLVSLANNHILDYMEDGIIETQATLDSIGVQYSGAGLNAQEAYQPAFLNKKGINIAFLASSDRTGQYNNYQPYLQAAYDKAGFAYQTPYYIQQQIAAVEDVADLIVIESHSGSEYSSGPGSHYDSENFVIPGLHDEEYSPFIDIPHMWDREIRHHMIDAGADAVIIHHPHIIQGMEIYKKKLIAHSLGNFIFDLSYYETMPTLILNAEAGLNGFEKYTLQPAFINNNLTQPVFGDFAYYLLKDIAHKSKELNTYLDIETENMTAEIIIDTLSMQQSSQIISENFQLDFIDTDYLSAPISLAQDGYIAGISRIYPGADWQGRVGSDLVWFGNMEAEGGENWNLNSEHEWYDEAEPFSGERSICLRLFDYLPTNYVTNFQNRIRLDAEQIYSLYGHIKTQNAFDASIEISYYSSRTAYYPLETEDIGSRIEGDSDWTFYFKQLDIPSEANFFDIRLTNAPPESGEGFAWFDNVGLIQWEEWQTQTQMQQIINPNHYTFLQLQNPQYQENALVEYNNRYYHTAPLVSADHQPQLLPKFALKNYPNPFYPHSNTRQNQTIISWSAPDNLQDLKLD
ncbi:MAG: CapA family protein, partial [Candidatus Cloacimonadales bacterium]